MIALKTLLLFFSSAFTTEYELYNSQKSLCCDGVVHPLPKPDGYTYYCCGQNMVYYSTEEKDYIPDCCSDKAINSRLVYCFNNTTPIERPNGNYTALCGNSLNHLRHYNFLNQYCCGGGVYNYADNTKACCDSRIIDPRIHKCCFSSEYNNLVRKFRYEAIPYGDVPRISAECCLVKEEFKVYDDTKQVCLYGEVRDKQDEYERRCCGQNFVFKSGIWVLSETQTDDTGNDEVCMYSNSPIIILLANHSKLVCYKNELQVVDEDAQSCGEYNRNLYFKYKNQACCKTHVIDLTPEEITDGNFTCCYRHYSSTGNIEFLIFSSH